MSRVKFRVDFWEHVMEGLSIISSLVGLAEKAYKHRRLIRRFTNLLWDSRVAGVILFIFGMIWSVYTMNNGTYGGMANPVGWYGWVFYGSNLGLGGLCIVFGFMFMSFPGRRKYYQSR
jgi:hypothetical protein